MKIPVEQAEAELSAIRQLTKHPGWPLLCAHFAKGFAELKESTFDANISDEVATRLRHAVAVVEAFDPAKLAQDKDAKLSRIVKKAELPPT
jgi:hypothetical protein